MTELTGIELTVQQFAKVEGVTERQVRTWIAKGAVEVRRTVGGGIRIIERRHEVRERAVFFSMKSAEDPGSLSR